MIKNIIIQKKRENVFLKLKKKFILFREREDILINLLKNCSFVSQIDVGTPDIILKITENFIKSYDCFIYDFKENTYSNNKKENVIKSYINSGGSFLITHDK